MLKDILLSVGLEVIDHQKPLLYTELTRIVGLLRPTIVEQRGGDAVALLAAMDKAIFKFTGLVVLTNVSTQQWTGASIVIVPKSKSHPFYNRARTNRVSQVGVNVLLRTDLVKGMVDLKNSRVTGDLTKDDPSDLVLTEGLFGELVNLTDEEIASIVLHELGHLLTYYEFLGRSMVANAVMADVTRTWTDQSETKIRIAVLKNVEKLYDFKFDDIQRTATDDSADTVSVIVNAASTDQLRREMGTRYYDSRLSEAMADRFATRHGAGVALVSALHKLALQRPVWFRNVEHRPFPYTLAVGLVELCLLSIVPLGLSIGLTASLVGVGWGMKALFGFNDTYDNPSNRYKAIRREIIDRLKDGGLSTEDKASVVAGLDKIDEFINQLNQHGNLLSTKAIGVFMADWLSGRRNEMKFNRQLEELANNNLYVSAARLDLLKG